MRYPSGVEDSSNQHRLLTTTKSERFLREFDLYDAIYEKVETKRRLDLTVHLLAIGKRVRYGNAGWARQDLHDIAGWKGLRPSMLMMETDASDLEGRVETALRIEDETSRIGALCRIRGIGPVLTSVVLMFTWPETCGFMDYHTCSALRYLGFGFPRKHCASRFTVPQLLTYLRIVRALGERKGTTAMEIVKALYALDRVSTKNNWREQFESKVGSPRKSRPIEDLFVD